MADAFLTQDQADALLAMPKISATADSYDFPTPGVKHSIPLVSENEREQFMLDLYRGRIEMQKVTYQNRGRQVVILARVDLNGSSHRNPDGEELECPHLHVYREGFGDKWAVPLPPDRFTSPDDLWQTYQEFLDFCNIIEPPTVNQVLI